MANTDKPAVWMATLRKAREQRRASRVPRAEEQWRSLVAERLDRLELQVRDLVSMVEQFRNAKP